MYAPPLTPGADKSCICIWSALYINPSPYPSCPCNVYQQLPYATPRLRTLAPLRLLLLLLPSSTPTGLFPRLEHTNRVSSLSLSLSRSLALPPDMHLRLFPRCRKRTNGCCHPPLSLLSFSNPSLSLLSSSTLRSTLR